MNRYKLSLNDLKPYLPLDKIEIKNDVEVHYLGVQKVDTTRMLLLCS